MILVEPDQRWRLMKKRCTRCHEQKRWTEFTPQRYWPDGSVRYVSSSCKPCRAAAQRTPLVRAQKAEWWQQRRDLLKAEVLAQKSSPRLPVKPFRTWLRAEKKKAPLSMISARTGISERSLSRVLEENCAVELDLVDRVLVASSIRLEDLYTEEELAA